MEKRIISFSPPDISELEIEEVCETLRSGWITTGSKTKLLERRLAAYIDTGMTDVDCDSDENIVRYSNRLVCVNSATAAEEINFRICGIGEGDEVIVPAYTYTATASSAIHCGAKVVFVDSQKDSMEMDYDKVAEAITDKTKAIVSVDLGGIITDFDRLYEVAEEKRSLFVPGGNTDLGKRIQKAIGRVLIFADDAHALGASKNGIMAGGFADFTDFSFHAVKNLTTGEGGAATWRRIPGIADEEIYDRYKLYIMHGQTKDSFNKNMSGEWEYDILGTWYKYNMTDIMAAIGLKQLDRYPAFLKRRKEIIEQYDKMCDDLGVGHTIHYTGDIRSSGHLYLTRIPGISEELRREIIVKLAGRGVSTNVHYKPLPMMTAYKEMGWDIKDFPNAYDYYANLITLPLHTKLTDEDVDYVISNYKEVVSEYIQGRTKK
ncbi:MAG: DegT/DnrJ/EryC1/StrS family aminotransferase [Oribacterium sp.]|nr:DegT/DnrJ/EryC1/StrS family aminotransferase [Oribacterium sp.]